MLNLERKKKRLLLTAMTLLIAGGTMLNTNTSNAFADTPKDNGIENYTFTEASADAEEIRREEGISSVTLKANSIIVEYEDGQVKEFDNNEYKMTVTAVE